MCGIVGIVGQEARSRSELLGKMQEEIRHRGPDEGGAVHLPNALLGSRRLAILDLEGGCQPISNEDGTVFVVFNGEIYDHVAHRTALCARGHDFRTTTDTEILVHAYEERQEDFLDGLNGMFGLAVYDQEEDKLILARDRLGKKPLYYTLRDGLLYFASELKALLVDPDLPRRVDLKSLSQYLSVETVPAPRTILEGIHKLAPGFMLIFSKGQPNLKRYWDASFVSESSALSEGEALERLDLLLDRAVRRRLVADVPVGIFLSGGIDSSTVTYFATRCGARVHTYSIGFEESSFDESAYARKVASSLGTEHLDEVLSSSKAVELLPAVARNLDEPFSDASILPTYLLSRFTRRHVKVALGGDGGDELFLGYPTYMAHSFYPGYQCLPAFVRDTLIPALIERLPVSFEDISLDFKLRRFISGRRLPPPHRNLVWLGSFGPDEKMRVLSEEARAQLTQIDNLGFVEDLLDGLEVKDELEKIVYVDLKVYLAEDILQKVDRASMANSLEVRAPLLDYELVEFILGLPVSCRLRGLQSKKLLKKLMRGRLPDSVIDRPKKGFGMPVAHWIQGPLKEAVRDQLSPVKLRREGFFDPKEVDRLLREHEAGKKDHRKLLWTLFMFEMWLEEYGPLR